MIGSESSVNGCLALLERPECRHYYQVSSFSDRSEQLEQNLELAFALARFKIANDRYPAELNELTPKYLAAIPDDLFAAKPMIYRRTADGYLLYSVGINGKDDGGKTYGDEVGADDLRVHADAEKAMKTAH